MPIELMRKMDFWLGIPLCFISSLWFRLTLKFKLLLIKRCQKHSDKTPKNTLLIGLSEMGSLVLAQACLNKLAENSSLFFICFKNNKPAVDLLKIIPDQHTFTIDVSSVSCFMKDSLKFFFWVRKQRISVVVDLELFSRFSALLGAYSGASKHIGFYRYNTEGLYRGTFFTHPVAYNPHIHISKNFLSLAYAADYNNVQAEQFPLSKRSFSSTDTAIDTIDISETEKKQIKNMIKQLYADYDQQPIILINSEGGDLLPLRNWGQEKFYQLIQLLLAHETKPALILLTGSIQERNAIENLKLKVNHRRCINFAGAVSLQQLLALYSISQYMVTNDSGPNHFASLTSMRTYALFGPETPELYGSLGNTINIYKQLACSPCVTAANQRKTACSDNVCMQQISPIEVYQIINSIEK